jgi:TonB-linked SusC/RagA family outer membrane protein
VKNGKGSTSTDAGGNFLLKNVNENAVLVVSYLGYVTSEQAVSKDFAYIILKQSRNKLDEVQVIAYGTTSRRLSTGNISTVKANEIEKSPVLNPLLAIQGRVPGIFIEQVNGLAGSGVKIRIQGQNSIAGGNEPLYVIDGVPFTSRLLPGITNTLDPQANPSAQLGAGAGNPLNFINPNDIESIDVLKDADATSIYGSRAANGAILITTRKGKAGETRVDLNMQQGWGKVVSRLKMMNTEQYLSLRREAFTNDKINQDDPPYNDPGYKTEVYPDLTSFDQTRYTDWQKVFTGGTSAFSDVRVGVSGGGATTQFASGVDYKRQSSVFRGDFDDEQVTLNFNVSSASTNNKFKLNFGGYYLYDQNNVPPFDFTEVSLITAPNSPSLYSGDGMVNFAPVNGLTSFDNPVKWLSSVDKILTKNLIINADASFEILPGLSLKGNFGFTDLATNEVSTAPLSIYVPEWRSFMPRSAEFANGDIRSWIVEPNVSYKRPISKGTLSVLLGATLQRTDALGQRLRAEGFANDLSLEDINSASAISRNFNGATTSYIYKYSALFARMNYNWRDRYILNATARRDGSSRFGAKNQFANFGSIGAAWLFSNEDLIRSGFKWLSFGKLSASYGTTGNDQIRNYAFMGIYNPTDGLGRPYQGQASLNAANLSNPYLQWESTRKLNFALDLGFWDDRVLFNVNYYYNRSSNQLLDYSLPFTTGFSSILSNFPATVVNKGIESSLSVEPIKSKGFNWNINLNFTLPKNVLNTFPDLANSSYASSLVIGQSLNIRRYYRYAGVNPQTGLYQVYKADGSLTSTPDGTADRTVFINPDPKFYGGVQNTFNYRNFTLSFLLQYVKQRAEGLYFGLPEPGFFNANQPARLNNRWLKPGDQAEFQKAFTGLVFIDDSYAASAAARSSDKNIGDASFLRLKNVSLSWSLPSSLTQKLKLKNMRLYAQGQNLFTITDYIGLDPETKSTTTLPPLRMITFGAQVGF